MAACEKRDVSEPFPSVFPGTYRLTFPTNITPPSPSDSPLGGAPCPDRKLPRASQEVAPGAPNALLGSEHALCSGAPCGAMVNRSLTFLGHKSIRQQREQSRGRSCSVSDNERHSRRPRLGDRSPHGRRCRDSRSAGHRGRLLNASVAASGHCLPHDVAAGLRRRVTAAGNSVIW